MIKNVVVEVESREEKGKNACRRIRASGKVPAILYGLDRPAFAIAVNPRHIDAVLKSDTGRNTIFNVALGGDQSKKRSVMIREIQRDPLTEHLVHLDFVRVDLDKRLTVHVPVHPVGLPEGVKNEGGVLDFVQRVVEVECLPANIPEHLEVDVSGLHINQHVSVSDLVVGDDIRILDEADTTIAVVIAPRIEAEEEPAEAEAEAEAAPTEEGGEPEVIKKGKEGEAKGDAESKGD